MIVTQRLEVEERRVDGKVRGRSKRGSEREKRVHDNHDSNMLV